MSTTTIKKKRKKDNKTLHELTSRALEELSRSKKIEEESLLLDKSIRTLLFQLFQKQTTPQTDKRAVKKTPESKEITDKVLEEKKTQATRKIDDAYHIKPGEVPPVYQARHAGAMDYVPPVDYDQLFAHMGVGKETLPGTTYTAGTQRPSTMATGEHAGPMTYQEGSDVVNRVNISLNLQVYDNVSADEKERFEYWKIFNKHLRRIYDHASVVRGARDGASFKPMIHKAKA